MFHLYLMNVLIAIVGILAVCSGNDNGPRQILVSASFTGNPCPGGYQLSSSCTGAPGCLEIVRYYQNNNNGRRRRSANGNSNGNSNGNTGNGNTNEHHNHIDPNHTCEWCCPIPHPNCAAGVLYSPTDLPSKTCVFCCS